MYEYKSMYINPQLKLRGAAAATAGVLVSSLGVLGFEKEFGREDQQTAASSSVWSDHR